jgi:hypothetical protein
MKPDKKEMLIAIFVSMLVLSNILSAKIITVNRITVSGGVLCYGITFLVTDVIGELYGREEANKTVIYGLFCQIMCSMLILITANLPAKDKVIGEAFDAVLKNNIWFTAASLTAYIISQTLDVKIFHLIKGKSERNKWIRNNLSTMTSQAADTFIYITIAFGAGMSLWNYKILLDLMISQYLIKVVLAVADTPFFYYLTRRKTK